MKSIKPAVLLLAAASFYGCGGCQEEPKTAPAPAAATVTPAPEKPAAAAPQAAKPEGQDDETELIMWASSEPDSGPPPLTVTFSVESLEEGFDAPIYEWDFGDGSPVSKEASPVHTYHKPGQYTAKVTVTSNGMVGHDETWVEVEGAKEAAPG